MADHHRHIRTKDVRKDYLDNPKPVKETRYVCEHYECLDLFTCTGRAKMVKHVLEKQHAHQCKECGVIINETKAFLEHESYHERDLLSKSNLILQGFSRI